MGTFNLKLFSQSDVLLLRLNTRCLLVACFLLFISLFSLFSYFIPFLCLLCVHFTSHRILAQSQCTLNICMQYIFPYVYNCVLYPFKCIDQSKTSEQHLLNLISIWFCKAVKPFYVRNHFVCVFVVVVVFSRNKFVLFIDYLCVCVFFFFKINLNRTSHAVTMILLF